MTGRSPQQAASKTGRGRKEQERRQRAKGQMVPTPRLRCVLVALIAQGQRKRRLESSLWFLGPTKPRTSTFATTANQIRNMLQMHTCARTCIKVYTYFMLLFCKPL